MNFKGNRKTLSFIQENNGNIKNVFELLCPVREKEWLDGWKYKMIYSRSGFIEQDCVFSTPFNNQKETIWQVTQYNKTKFYIEFLRITPGENVVKINIQLKKTNTEQTQSHITYQYTGLSPEQNCYINNQLEKDFIKSMIWWEKAINFYLKNKEMLKK